MERKYNSSKSYNSYLEKSISQLKAKLGLFFRNIDQELLKSSRTGPDSITFPIKIEFKNGVEIQTTDSIYSNLYRIFYEEIFNFDIIHKIDHAKDRHPKDCKDNLVIVINVRIDIPAPPIDLDLGKS